MKQYNIEDQLQRKLKERTITPSAEAWDRISYNRHQQKKKKKHTVWYWTVAAVAVISLSGILLILLNDSNTIITPEQKVVEKQTKPTGIKVIPEKIIQKELKNEIVFQNEKSNINTTSVIEHILTVRQEVKPINMFPNSEIVKANEVAIAIHEIAMIKGKVTDQEVDSLLHKAQREIAIDRLKNKNLPTDDTALLNETEKEMENSFREKTFSIFKLQFKTIKIALKDKQEP